MRNSITEQNKKLSKLDERITDATQELTNNELNASQMAEEMETSR